MDKYPQNPQENGKQASTNPQPTYPQQDATQPNAQPQAYSQGAYPPSPANPAPQPPPANQAAYGASGRPLPPPYIPPIAVQPNLPSASPPGTKERQAELMAKFALWLGVAALVLAGVQILAIVQNGTFYTSSVWMSIMLTLSSYLGNPCQLGAVILGIISITKATTRSRGIAGVVMGGVAMVLRVVSVYVATGYFVWSQYMSF